jgi:hypothetical protein
MLPNDDKEQERLDILHHVFRLTLDGGLCCTQPELRDPGKILDIGTGTGVWAIDSRNGSYISIRARLTWCHQWAMSFLRRRLSAPTCLPFSRAGVLNPECQSGLG